MPSIRLATASPSTQDTTSSTLALLSKLAVSAAHQSVDLLLLPEAFIGGYPRGSSFGCVIGERKPSGRDEYADYFDRAVDLGDIVGDGNAGAGEKWVRRELSASPSSSSWSVGEKNGDDGIGQKQGVRGDGTREELERIAKETGVFIVTGLIERAGGSLYCAVVYVCPHQGIIGKRRKVMPTGTERLVWAQGCPSTLRAVSTTIRGIRINLAAAICWESYMPLLRQALYAQNINLYLAPTADGRDAWLSLMRTVGIEGRCFVVSSNMAVPASTAAGTATTTTATQGPPSLPMRGSSMSVAGSVISEEDGPPHATGASPSHGVRTSPSRRKRRKSVFDDDGNEIVLCCPEDTKLDGVDNTTSAIDSTAAVETATNGKVSSWASRGGSCIVNPFGDVLAGPQWEDPHGIIYADVDLRDCIRGRLDFDAAGSYSRSDSFKFGVNGLDLEPLPY